MSALLVRHQNDNSSSPAVDNRVVARKGWTHGEQSRRDFCALERKRKTCVHSQAASYLDPRLLHVARRLSSQHVLSVGMGYLPKFSDHLDEA